MSRSYLLDNNYEHSYHDSTIHHHSNIHYGTDRYQSRGATVVSNKMISCYKILNEALSTHRSLNDSDIEYAIDIVCQLRPSITNEQFALIILYLAKDTYTGKFALSFNQDMDVAVKRRDPELIKLLLYGPVEMFVELYDNPELNEKEVVHIKRMFNREYNALLSALENGAQQSNQDIDYLIPCKDKETVFARKMMGKESSLTLYRRCYGEVCLAEVESQGHASRIDAELLQADQIARKIYAPDVAPGKHIPSIYCFETDELIPLLSQASPINPYTGYEFSDFSLGILHRKFSKEIKMYKRYLQQKSQAKTGISTPKFGTSVPTPRFMTKSKTPRLTGYNRNARMKYSNSYPRINRSHN